jgi:hypothetical protein
MHLNNKTRKNMRTTRNGGRRGEKLRCEECGAPFEPWDEIFTWELGRGRTELVCEDCFDGLFGELSRRERAELIGSRVTTAEELGAK